MAREGGSAPDRLQFHVVSFEGPDGYSRAGGLASRVDGLSRALAGLGYDTHLWFVGDPELPGHEERSGVKLHRWCQWISRSHLAGVYDGEEDKRRDFSLSLAPHLLEQVLAPHLAAGGEGVVMAEEWHTVEALLDLDRRLRESGRRGRVALLWNANNLFGFERIDWERLRTAATLTTVSRAMRLRIETRGAHPLVIANGLPPEAFEPPDRSLVTGLRKRFAGRLALVKVARWDPDKAWLSTVESVRRMRDEGLRPLLVARGGSESHEGVVRDAVAGAGLRWRDAPARDGDPADLLAALEAAPHADVVCLRLRLDSGASRALFRAADAVLANSRFEPFGLVGLEAMAVGGVACTGLSGEDYAVPGRNALVMQTDDPRELVAVLTHLRNHPEEEDALRRAARQTARSYAWSEILRRVLLPRIRLLREAVL